MINSEIIKEIQANWNLPWHLIDHPVYGDDEALRVNCKRCNVGRIFGRGGKVVTVSLKRHKFVLNRLVSVYFGICAGCNEVYWARQAQKN